MLNEWITQIDGAKKTDFLGYKEGFYRFAKCNSGGGVTVQYHG
jgi:hypothetical protein